MSFESVLNPVTFNREVNLYFNGKKISKVFQQISKKKFSKNSLVVKIESSYDFFIGKKENEKNFLFLFFAKPEECKSS